MLLISNNISTLNFNEVIAKNGEIIQNIKFYYIDNGKERLIFGGDNGPRFIEEDDGYSEYNLNKLKNKELYLSIKTNKNEYNNIPIEMTLEYVNNNIFPKKEKPIGDENSQKKNFLYYKDFLLSNNFTTEDNNYFEKKLNENTSIYIYFDTIKVDILDSNGNFDSSILTSLNSDNIIFNEINNGAIVDSYDITSEETIDCNEIECNSINDYVSYINYLKYYINMYN